MIYFLIAMLHGFDGNTTFLISEKQTLEKCLVLKKTADKVKPDEGTRFIENKCLTKDDLKKELAK